MPNQDKLTLSRETAEHLLEGISFFKENPAAKEWQNLDKDLFVFLCHELCQLPAEEEESLNDYLARAEDFLKKIISEELTAPSLPQNLKELVEAWENLSIQKDAHVLPPPKVNFPTVEDWIKTLKEKRSEEEVAPKVKEALETAAPHLSSQDKAVLEEKISEEIAKTPYLISSSNKKEEIARQALQKSLEEKQIVLGEEQKQALAKAMATPSFSQKEPKPKKVITPPVFKKFQEQIEQVLKASLKTTGKIDKETLAEVSPLISKAVASNLPFLSQGELETLNLTDKTEIAEKTTTAVLGTIGEALVAKGISLSPSQTATLLDQLTITTNSNLENLAAIEPENRLPQEKTLETEGTATPILASLLHPKETADLVLNPQLRRSLEALDKDPSLPLNLTVEGEEISQGEKIKNIFLQKGINFQSINLVKPLKEETESLILAAKGITSADLSLAIKTSREENRPVEEISKLEQLFTRQLDFEKKFPKLSQKFYRLRQAQEIISGQKNDQKLSSWPFAQIKSQTNLKTTRWKILEITNRFLAKIGLAGKKNHYSGETVYFSKIWYYPQKISQAISSFWQKTGIGKTIGNWFSRQTHHFWQNTLGQIRGFSRVGVKKAVQEGAQKGVTKAITWLSTKLAATKLGATLGSIAPGIGNAVGAVVGFVVDAGISLFKKGGEFLEKLTGGQTEAEQKLKAALGPFSFLVSPLVLIFIIALGAPLILIFLTVTNIGGAFLGPAGGEEAVPSLPSLPSLPPNIDNHLAESVIQIIRDCGYKDPDPEKYGTSYINKDNIDDIVACINASSLSDSQKDAIVSNFKTSVGDHTSLQCVGFAQAIADAQGIFLPDECGHAKGYINCPYIPSSRYTNEPSVGVFAVFGSGTWGHIGIITAVTANEDGIKKCRFASAGGNPDNSNGGDIDVVEYPCDSFDALIKPN